MSLSQRHAWPSYYIVYQDIYEHLPFCISSLLHLIQWPTAKQYSVHLVTGVASGRLTVSLLTLQGGVN